jgi:hypothetical protein
LPWQIFNSFLGRHFLAALLHLFLALVWKLIMTVLFNKLNLSTQNVIHVLHAPASFEAELTLVTCQISRQLEPQSSPQFVLAFVQNQQALDALSQALVAQMQGDNILWFAYPKASSKRYRCDFNRDSGWTILANAGYEPVRMVAIDMDWSALRFRKVEFIKSLKRDPSRALSAAGKQRAASE